MCIRDRLKPQLDAPPFTGNAVVDGSLRQIRYVLNRMISDLGEQPEQIVVEMARELSVGVSKRNELESENNKNRTARINAEKAIRDASIVVTPTRVRRYLLWQEQGAGHCPYCSKTITLAAALSLSLIHIYFMHGIEGKSTRDFSFLSM